jgi:hypothetical protein
VAKEFSLNFYGAKTKVGILEFEVCERTMLAATDIPSTGERWFKAMTLSAAFSREFLKPEYQEENFSKGVPINHML